MERNSKRRSAKLPETLLNIEDIGESSDDSDFRIEDHCLDDSDSSDRSEASDSSDESSDSEGDDSDDNDSKKDVSNKVAPKLSDTSVLQSSNQIDDELIKKTLICCVCLGDRSDDTNEIIECDGCGITVHEGCYGVPDTVSLSSTVSSCSTEPWFCEACRAGIENPTCELCPNSGGIFKETDVGKWVHLVCALYIPGIAFDETGTLSNVTLFGIPSSKWGNKACQLCQDTRFVRTGMTIECDAGMCRVFFHVTCGQREGLLAEATHEEVDEQADPFYAHCKLHSDKNEIKKRKRNWLALQLRTQKIASLKNKESSEETQLWKRNQRKLANYRVKYSQSKMAKHAPWVPQQKRPRLLTTSASACRNLWKKAELMGVDTASFEETEAMITTLQDIPKKWCIPPAFSVEFVGYFLDRDSRVSRLKKQLSHHAEDKIRMTNEQPKLQKIYDSAIAENSKFEALNETLRKTISQYHDIILKMKPKAKLPSINNLTKTNSHSDNVKNNRVSLAKVANRLPTLPVFTSGIDAAVNSSNTVPEDKVSVTLNNKCGICDRTNDQHLLVKCDTCFKYYHLGCLDPPLTRMPKKTKLMGWQCEDCDKESSDSDLEIVDPEAPRKLRKSSKERDPRNDDFVDPFDVSDLPETRKVKKRKRDKHRDRYSPDLELPPSAIGRHRNRKRKHKSAETGTDNGTPRQGIKLFIKSVPNSSGQANFIATQTPPNVFVSSTEGYVKDEMTAVETRAPRAKTSKTNVEMEGNCDTCQEIGSNTNMVKCDECSKSFHFNCLDPPVKKSPKVRGYSWHCASCDPTDTDSN